MFKFPDIRSDLASDALCAPGWSMHIFKQFARTDRESFYQLDDVLDGDVPFAALEATDVVAVQCCSFCEFLLGVAASFPQGANGSSEKGLG